MFEDSLQSLLMLSGLGIFIWLLMRSKMKRKKFTPPVQIGPLKHNANANSSPSQFTGTNSLGAPREVLKWQVELHDLGRDIKAELDSKMLAVQSITRSYDAAANRLGQMIKLAEQTPIHPDSPVAQARQLAAKGWTHEKIAQSLAMPISDVEAILTEA